MQQIQYDVRPGEFADAMKSTRAARMLFWLLLGAAILFQLAAFALVDFGGVLDEESALAASPAASPAPAGTPAAGADASPAKPADAKPPEKPAKPAKPAKGGKADKTGKAEKGTTPPPQAKASASPSPAQPAAGPAAPAGPAPRSARTQRWYNVLRWSLPAAKFLATVAGLLLALTLLFAVGLSLVGKLGGTAGMISAFYWSLILFMMVIPWQQVLTNATLACGALYNLGELLEARRSWVGSGTSNGRMFYYARFVGYPGAALLVWLVVHLRFTRGAMRMVFPHALPPAVAPAPTAASTPAGATQAPAAAVAGPAGPEHLVRKEVEKAPAPTAGRGAPPLHTPGPLTERLARVQNGKADK